MIRDWSRKRHVVIGALIAIASVSHAESNVSATNRYAYGANIGWMDARADGDHGAVFGQYYATGYVWSANTGWISLGNGPTNGWSYGNASADDWGVNHLATGNLSGYAYGANVGWISLSNAQAYVRVDNLDPGPDTDADGIADAYEYKYAGALTNLNAAGDYDDDLTGDVEEYLAGTNPDDDASALRMVSLERSGASDLVTWRTEPTRFYRIEQTTDPLAGPWVDSGLGVFGPTAFPDMTQPVAASSNQVHYRAVAVIPLAP